MQPNKCKFFFVCIKSKKGGTSVLPELQKSGTPSWARWKPRPKSLDSNDFTAI